MALLGQQANAVAGGLNYIKRHLPDRLDDKIAITNARAS